MSQEDFRGSMHEFDDVEIEESMLLQNPQLKLLRTLGVARMIEQEVGIEIPPLVFEDDPTQPQVDLMRTLKMGMPNDGYFSGKWTLIPMLSPTDKGVFDTTLRITASRVPNQKVEKPENTHYVQSVLIEFTQDKHLKVVGDKTTFEGNLTTVNDGLLAQVQTGIQEAFTNPQTRSGTTEFYLMGNVTPRQSSRVG